MRHGYDTMSHRLLAVLLTMVLLGTGYIVSPCLQGHCSMSRAKACCQHGGITRPSCCPPFQEVGYGAIPAAAKSSTDGAIPVASGLSMPAFGPAPRSVGAAVLSTLRTAAPPGTLLDQRTSLVV